MARPLLFTLLGAGLASIAWYFSLAGELKSITKSKIAEMAKVEGSDMQISICQESQRSIIASYLSADLTALEAKGDAIGCKVRNNAEAKYRILLETRTPQSDWFQDTLESYNNFADNTACTLN